LGNIHPAVTIRGFLLLRSGLGKRLLQGCKFFGDGHVNPRQLRSVCRSGGSLCQGFCSKYSSSGLAHFEQHQLHATRS